MKLQEVGFESTLNKMTDEEKTYYCCECGHQLIPIDEEQLQMCEENEDDIMCEECYDLEYKKVESKEEKNDTNQVT